MHKKRNLRVEPPCPELNENVCNSKEMGKGEDFKQRGGVLRKLLGAWRHPSFLQQVRGLGSIFSAPWRGPAFCRRLGRSTPPVPLARDFLQSACAPYPNARMHKHKMCLLSTWFLCSSKTATPAPCTSPAPWPQSILLMWGAGGPICVSHGRSLCVPLLLETAPFPCLGV